MECFALLVMRLGPHFESHLLTVPTGGQNVSDILYKATDELQSVTSYIKYDSYGRQT